MVYKLKGKDLDRGYNGLLSFVISGGDETHGAWDIKNVKSSLLVGEIIQEAHLVVASKLDREEFSSYLLNISIWDQGNPPKVASRLLSIKVIVLYLSILKYYLLHMKCIHIKPVFLDC